MTTTVTASKTVSFKSPYTGATFQRLTSLLLGQDGCLTAADVSDDLVDITVAVGTTICQRGIVATSTAAGMLAVPTGAQPWYLLAAIPDDDPDSGLYLSVTADPVVAAGALVVATKSNNTWTAAPVLDIASGQVSAATPGIEQGADAIEVMDAGGLVTELTVHRGVVTGPDGHVLELARTGTNSAKALAVAPVRPSTLGNRNDHVVLRQFEGFAPELVHAMGGLVASDTTPSTTILASAIGLAGPSYHARRGGSLGQQWYAWGETTDLRIQGGPAGEAFAATTLLTSGTISATQLVGQRASDSAVLLLYVDGLNLRLVSFNPTTAAQIDAPVTLESLTGQISHVRAVLDRNELLHIVFEHDEGPRQQVYYARCGVVLGATFGALDVAAKVVEGADTGNNDTWPSLGVSRDGTVTIAHVRGTGSNEFGSAMIVTTLDATGALLATAPLFAASDVGIDSGAGAVAAAMLNLRHTAVVITALDEVRIFTLGLSVATDVDYVLVHCPELVSALGFDLVNPVAQMEAGFSLATIAACAGELGEICLAVKLTGALNAVKYRLLTLDAGLLAQGLVVAPLHELTFESYTETTGFVDLRIRPGQLGEVVVSYLRGLKIYATALAPLAQAEPTPHRQDVRLGTWTVPSAPSASIDGWGYEFEVFNARPKKLNYPFLVGNEGDYQGYGSLAAAAAVANRLGGQIVVRPGQHALTSELRLLGGVSLIGEGDAIILLSPKTTTPHGLVLGNDWTYSAHAITVAGNVVSSVEAGFGLLRSGDQVDVGTSGKHTVMRALGYDTTSGTYKVLVEPNAAGSPVTAGFGTPRYAGIAVENLTFLVPGAAMHAALEVKTCTGARLKNLRFEGDTLDAGIGYAIMVGAYDSDDTLIDGCDFTQVTMGATDAAILVSGGENTAIRRTRFVDGKGMLKVLSTAQNVHLADCYGDGTDATKTLYDLVNTRTTPLFVSNCEGKFAGDATSLSLVHTEVGQRLRAPEALDALRFEDDNTRASTITDTSIKLTSVTHKEFDGTSKDVITDAVNERVKVGGDTMTGALTMGANIATNGATRDIGATGAATNRFNAFLNTVNMAASIVTDGTTRDIGATGAATNRFNTFLNTVNVLGQTTLQAALNMAANILTDGTTRVLGATGAATNRFDAFLNTVNTLGQTTLQAALNMSANILTDGTTRVVGATGAAGNRFDAHLNTVNALGLITAQAGLTASANQHVTVSGTGEYKHGSISAEIFPHMYYNDSNRWVATLVSLDNYVQSSAAATGAFTLPLEIGERLQTIKFRYYGDGATPDFAYRIFTVDTQGAMTALTATVTLTSFDGSWALATVTLNHTLAAGESFVVTVGSSATKLRLGTAGITYDRP